MTVFARVRDRAIEHDGLAFLDRGRRVTLRTRNARVRALERESRVDVVIELRCGPEGVFTVTGGALSGVRALRELVSVRGLVAGLAVRSLGREVHGRRLSVREQQARARAHVWRTCEGKEEKIPLSALLGFPPAIERRVLRQMIQGAGGHLRGVTHRHIEALRRFLRHSQSGHHLVLPGQLVARREFDWLIVGPAPPGGGEAGYYHQVEVPGE